MHLKCYSVHCENIDNVQRMFKNGWKTFLNALATFPNVLSKCCIKYWKQGHCFLPRCNKVNTANSTSFTSNRYSIEHQNSAAERIWFCLIHKEQFAATYIKLLRTNSQYPPELETQKKSWFRHDLFGSLLPRLPLISSLIFLSLFLLQNNHSLE